MNVLYAIAHHILSPGVFSEVSIKANTGKEIHLMEMDPAFLTISAVNKNGLTLHYP